MKYYLIAGEASGDLHGSNLMKKLKTADNDADFRFWGGDLMAQEGGTLVRHYKDTAVMGLVEVLCNFDKISSNLRLCKSDLIKSNPDVVILIDYPGFNFKIAKYAKKLGFKVFYYISPKVWAWNEGRVNLLKKYVDQLFIIFPFEVDYFQNKGIDAIYCGNPLVDKIEESGVLSQSRDEFLQRHSLEDKPSIALLAGSRKMEIEFLLPKMIQVEKKFGSQYQYLLAAAPSIDISFYRSYLDKFESNIIIIQNDTYSVVRHSAAAIVNSGTASLETAIIDTPQVVCYGAHPITIFLGKIFVKIPYISLGNLILGKLVFKELLQNDCSVDNISQELTRLVDDKEYIATMKSGYADIRKALGVSGATERIAKNMVKLLSNK